MKVRLFLLIALAAGLAPASAQLTKSQRAEAERVPALTVPSPAEFFAAIDKAGKPDWMSFYRAPAPVIYPTRMRSALNLGALVTDGYVAVEAQDGQQVKNTGKDIIALARSLGVGEDVLMRGKSITDFADKNDWFALREELEATTNEVRRAIMAQRDQSLAVLITVGAWLRALEVGSRAAELNGEETSADLLRQRELIAFLRSEVQGSADKARDEAVVQRTETTLVAVEEQMTVPEEEKLSPERVLAIKQTAGTFVADMAAKEE